MAMVSGLLAPLVSAAARSASAAPSPPAGHDQQVRMLGLPNGFRPGGLTSFGGTLYVSSLADGGILAVDQRSGHSHRLLPGIPWRSLRGLQVDPRSGLLFAAGNDGDNGVVLAVDRRSGHLIRRWQVPGAGLLRDLAITPDAVWVIDAQVDRLTRIPLGRGGRPAPAAMGQLPLGGAWPTPVGRRASGIRALPDGTLLLGHSTAGGLWAVPPDGGAVRTVPVTGGPAIGGGEGLERDGDQIWVVGGVGRDGVAQLRLDSQHGRLTARWVRELTDTALDAPSTAALVGGLLWAVNARVGPPDPEAGYWLTGLPIARRHR
jgi:hypothetical protein